MDKLDLEKLEILAKEATPGPWKYDCGNSQIEQEDSRAGICGIAWSDRHTLEDDKFNPIDKWCDGRYIAAANPKTILELINRIRELEKFIKEQALPITIKEGSLAMEDYIKEVKAVASTLIYKKPD